MKEKRSCNFALTESEIVVLDLSKKVYGRYNHHVCSFFVIIRIQYKLQSAFDTLIDIVYKCGNRKSGEVPERGYRLPY